MSEETCVVVGLNHMQIEAPAGCEAAARAFFGGLLGLSEIAKPANLQGRGGVWFACVAPNFEPRRKGHPALEVRGLDAWRERLAAASVPITDDEPLPGWKRFYISDPWGNRIELLERAEQQTHAADLC
jgi:catechol 2,3-dioxygenase-like lactoylglutathione lyase family enzyme